MPRSKKIPDAPKRNTFGGWLKKAGAFLRKFFATLLRVAVGEPAHRPPPVAPAADDRAPTDDAIVSVSSDAASTRATKGRVGAWSEGSITSLTGQLNLAPLVAPARSYRVYEPHQLNDDSRLLVVLHGCRQSATDIAVGTRLNLHADARGWPVLYPEQSKAANKYHCWNWFDTANLRGYGETSLIVAMQDEVQKRHGLGDAPAFLAGMSAGGALASILALRYPARWAAVAVHSGLPFGAAEDPFGAMRVMREGARNLADARALRVASSDAPGVPAMVLHGSADDVVHRTNADLLVRQFLGWNGYFADAAEWETAPLPAANAEQVKNAQGHPYILRRYERKGLQPVHECEVVGMGHAWSGGDASLPYNDALGPDASAMMMEFFAAIVERPMEKAA